MGEVDARDALVLPHSAEAQLVVQQAQLLDDVVHYQVDVDLRLAAHARLVGLAQAANLADVEALVWVQL